MFRKSEEAVSEALPAMLSARNKRSRVGITFVGEDDMVSGQISPPAVSASLWKIQVSETESSLVKKFFVRLESVTYYRLVSIERIQKFCNRVHSHSSCSSGKSKAIIITKFLMKLNKLI